MDSPKVFADAGQTLTHRLVESSAK